MAEIEHAVAKAKTVANGEFLYCEESKNQTMYFVLHKHILLLIEKGSPWCGGSGLLFFRFPYL